MGDIAAVQWTSRTGKGGPSPMVGFFEVRSWSLYLGSWLLGMDLTQMISNPDKNLSIFILFHNPLLYIVFFWITLTVPPSSARAYKHHIYLMMDDLQVIPWNVISHIHNQIWIKKLNYFWSRLMKDSKQQFSPFLC